MSASQESPAKGMASNRSVTRAVQVLRALAGSPAALTVSDIARRIALPRATTFRLLLTLEEEGMVDRQDTLYSLGWELGRLAQAVDPAAGLVPRIKDDLDAFADEVGETTTFSLRRGLFELDLVYQANPRRLGMTMADLKGLTWPPHASSTGKILLSELTPGEVGGTLSEPFAAVTPKTITTRKALDEELAKVREQGWSVTDEELEEGMLSYAVPVRDAVGGLVGAISLVGPLARVRNIDTEANLTDRLKAAAERVRRRMTAVEAG